MLNIVIPMAGFGQRFRNAGYDVPKPFIDVAGKPMIARVIENLAFDNCRYLLVCREEHIEHFAGILRELSRFGEVVLVPVNKPTEGSAATVLFAREYFDSDDPLLIANSDQLVDQGIRGFVTDAQIRNLDGSIMTFAADHPKWSYARLDGQGLVQEVREKQVISHDATVGIYYFQRGKDFVWAAVQMMIENDRTKGEFYTCPAYNYSIRRGRRIGIYRIEERTMHGLGTPEDLDSYLSQLTCMLSSR